MREFFSNLEKKQKMMFIGGAAAAAVLIIVIIICISLSGTNRNYRNFYDNAESAFLQGDYEEAIEFLEKAMDIDHTEECYLLMAEAYYASGDTNMAIQVLSLGNSRIGGSAIAKRLEELSGVSSGDEDDSSSGLEETVRIAGKDIKLSVKSLLLSGKGLTDSEVSGISRLKELESLGLSGNAITSLNFLADMDSINFLQLSDNKIADLSPLAGLANLKTLYIDNNLVQDFTPLYSLKALRTLSMKGMGITDSQL
ncbi:MAG: leucine-rich repeat domain-containing protein, partial [Oscillospiraceae bacterium]|nr:leucine-rich repeat domain-containing protein [Oscillospiraceae bacterium]